MKTLFAGPYIGELGWELFNWQGYIRKISEDYDRVIVSGRASRRLIYADFCNEYVPYETDVNNCAGFTSFYHKYKGSLHEKYNPTDFIYVDNESSAQDIFTNKEQKFIKYGKKDNKHNFDIIIHARMIKHWDSYKTSRNWSIENWEKLVDLYLSLGYKVASIGIPGSAVHIKKTINLMNIELEELADILSDSKVTVGPSSGPMHFASLCGCPHLVWTSSDPGIGLENKENYERRYNPFKTKVMVCSQSGGWNPSVDLIFEKTKELLSDL